MSKFLKAYIKFENVFTAVTLLIGISMIVYGVVMRYIFRNPQAWVDELSIIILVYSVTLGFSMVTRRNDQIVMDAIDMVLKKPSKVMEYAANIFSFIFSVFLAYFGYLATIQQAAANRVTPLLLIPREYVYIIIPITGVLMAIQYAWRLIRPFIGKTAQINDPDSTNPGQEKE